MIKNILNFIYFHKSIIILVLVFILVGIRVLLAQTLYLGLVGDDYTPIEAIEFILKHPLTM